MKNHKLYALSVFVFLFVLIGIAWLMLGSYAQAREDALGQLRFQARMLAGQTARGIQSYILNYHNSLSFLSGLPEIRDLDPVGKELIRLFYLEQAGDIRGITRIDENGIITWSWPDQSVVGRDVSKQEHNQKLLYTERPVLSDVFQAVQGYKAVALAVPVRDENGFHGSLTILIPFEGMARRFVADITIGESGYALLTDSVGTVLYSPAPAHVGRNLREIGKDSPSLLMLANRMLHSVAGDAEYYFDSIRGERTGILKKTARYEAIPMLDTFWNVLVTVPEREAYGYIGSFTTRWVALAIILVLGILIWVSILIRVLARSVKANIDLGAANASLGKALRELGDAQARLVRSEKLATLGQMATSVAHQVNNPLAAMRSAGGNIETIVEDNLCGLVMAIARLEAEARARFCALVARGVEKLMERPESHEHDRPARLAIARELSARGLAKARELADELDELCVLDEWRQFLPLLERPDALEIASAGRRLASMAVSSRIIQVAVARVGAVTKALERYVSGSRQAEAGPVDVNDSINTVLTLSASMTRSLVDLASDFCEDCVVSASYDQLAQLWTVLVTNALEAIGSSGSLAVRSRREGALVVVEVQDDGPGVPTELRERIFEPFFTTKGYGEGSGLGLDIARQIASSLGGSIELESEPGRTVFRVILPAYAEP